MAINRYSELSYSSLRDLPLMALPFEQMNFALTKAQESQDQMKAISDLPLTYLSTPKDTAEAVNVQNFITSKKNALADLAKSGDTKAYLAGVKEVSDQLISLHKPGGAAYGLKSRYEQFNKGKETIDAHLKTLKEHRNIHETVYTDQLKKSVEKGLNEAGDIYDPRSGTFASIGTPQLHSEYNIPKEMDVFMKDFAKSKNVDVSWENGMYVFKSEKGNEPRLMSEALGAFFQRPEVANQLKLEYQYDNITKYNTPELREQYTNEFKLAASNKMLTEAQNVVPKFDLAGNTVKMSKSSTSTTAFQEKLNSILEASGLPSITTDGAWGTETQKAFDDVKEILGAKALEVVAQNVETINGFTFDQVWSKEKQSNYINGIIPKYSGIERDIRMQQDGLYLQKVRQANDKKMLDHLFAMIPQEPGSLYNPTVIDETTKGDFFASLKANTQELTGSNQQLMQKLHQNLSPAAREFIETNYSSNPQAGLQILNDAVESGDPEAYFKGNPLFGVMGMGKAVEAAKSYAINDLNAGSATLHEIKSNNRVINSNQEVEASFNNKVLSSLTPDETESLFIEMTRSTASVQTGQTHSEILKGHQQKARTQGVSYDVYKKQFVVDNLPKALSGNSSLSAIDKDRYKRVYGAALQELNAQSSGVVMIPGNAEAADLGKTLKDSYVNMSFANLIEGTGDNGRKILNKMRDTGNFEGQIVSVLPVYTRNGIKIQMTNKDGDQIISNLPEMQSEEVKKRIFTSAFDDNGNVRDSKAVQQLALLEGKSAVAFPAFKDWESAYATVQRGNTKQVGKTSTVPHPQTGGASNYYNYLSLNNTGSAFMVTVTGDSANRTFQQYVSRHNGIDKLNEDLTFVRDKLNKGGQLTPSEIDLLMIRPVKDNTTDRKLHYNSYEGLIDSEATMFGTPIIYGKYNSNRGRIQKNQFSTNSIGMGSVIQATLFGQDDMNSLMSVPNIDLNDENDEN